MKLKDDNMLGLFAASGNGMLRQSRLCAQCSLAKRCPGPIKNPPRLKLATNK